MLTVVKNTENSNEISIPADEMEKLGISDGVEVEISKKENGEIILRSTSEAERKRKFDRAKNKIFEDWHDVFVELAKGADDEISKPEASGKFILIKDEKGKYKFQLIGIGEVLLETSEFDSISDARKAIQSLKKELSEIQDKIIDFPIID